MDPVLRERPEAVAADDQDDARREACARGFHAVSSPITGPKISTGTIGRTREAIEHRESNIGGEARSTSVRLAAVPVPSLMSSTQAIPMNLITRSPFA